MDQRTLPTAQEWIRHASTDDDALAASPAHGGGPGHGALAPGSATTLGASAGGRSRRALRPICGPTGCPRPPGRGPAWRSARAGGAPRDGRGACQGVSRAGPAGERAALSLGPAAPGSPPRDTPRRPVARAVPPRRLDRGVCRGLPGAGGGPEAPGRAPATISRLQQAWHDDLTHGQRRRLTGQREVSCRVDGGYVETRLAEARPCRLVSMGADASGQTALGGLGDGYRARSPGKHAGSTGTVVAWSTGHPGPVARARGGLGTHAATDTARRAGHDVGAIRRPRCGPTGRRPNRASRRSGWRPTASGLSWRVTGS